MTWDRSSQSFLFSSRLISYMNKIYQIIKYHHCILCSANLNNDSLDPPSQLTFLNSFTSVDQSSHSFRLFKVQTHHRNMIFEYLGQNSNQNSKFLLLSYLYEHFLRKFKNQFIPHNSTNFIFHFFFTEVSCQWPNSPVAFLEHRFKTAKCSFSPCKVLRLIALSPSH